MKRLLYLLLLGIIVLPYSCSKDNNDIALDPNIVQYNSDVSNLISEGDAINQEISNHLITIPVFGKNSAVVPTDICGASYDTSQLHDPIPTIIINFDSTTTCSNPSRLRSGKIKVELITGVHWSDIGAQIRLTFTRFKTTYFNVKQNSIRITGVKILTDVEGIDWVAFSAGTKNIKIRERSASMQIQFENNRNTTWSSARLSTWGFNSSSGDLSTIVNGDTTIDSKIIESWGTNRFGKDFTSQMVIPWESNTSCQLWKPTQGKYVSITTDFTIVTKLGLDSAGVDATDNCPYGLRLDWSLYKGQSSYKILGYQ